MKVSTIVLGCIGLFAATVAGVAIPDWHRPVHGVQTGPDGQSMAQFDNTGASTSFGRVARAPAAGTFDAAVHSGDPRMQAMTRAMTQMTAAINTKWRDHVGAQGVTCFTCHRNQAIPPETWFPRTPKETPSMVARSENWNETADTVRKFFPDNGWALYFLQDQPVHVESRTALRSNTVATALEAKRVYETMMQMSDGIGVNCGYCHTSRAFSDWKQSTPNRWIGYDAIRMTRDIDVNFLLPAANILPQSRTLVKQNSLVVAPGDRSDPPAPGLAVCATCHYGRTRPDVDTAAAGAAGKHS